MINMTYGAQSLQTDQIVTTGTDLYSAPTNEVQADELVDSDGALVVKQRYKSKTFSIWGYLKADSVPEADALSDELKIAMSQKNQAFDIDYAGGTRRYLATPRNIAVERPRGLTRPRFNIEFLSPDGMGWDLTSTSLLDPTGITTASSTQAITVGGSYQAEPLIYITINTVTGGAGQSLSLTNTSTLRGMKITRDWVDGDTVEINNLKKTVFVNDRAEEFSGQFLAFAPGEGGIGYVDTLTSRDVTMSASYTRRWL
ncbi:MAG: hypothetical protein WA991_03955 [Ornithinimicrobium sp.]